MRKPDIVTTDVMMSKVSVSAGGPQLWIDRSGFLSHQESRMCPFQDDHFFQVATTRFVLVFHQTTFCSSSLYFLCSLLVKCIMFRCHLVQSPNLKENG